MLELAAPAETSAGGPARGLGRGVRGERLELAVSIKTLVEARANSKPVFGNATGGWYSGEGVVSAFVRRSGVHHPRVLVAGRGGKGDKGRG